MNTWEFEKQLHGEEIPPPPLDWSDGFDEAEAALAEWQAAEDAAHAEEVKAALAEGEAEAEVEAALAPGGELSDEEATARGLATEDSMPRDRRLRWWEIVAWHDSIAPEWESRLRARPDVRALAIWHDMDIRDAATGELKKRHLHMMAGDSHGRKWSWRQAMRFAHDVLGLREREDRRLVRPIKSPSGYALYLTHANAPLKFQYPREAVLAFGGVDLDSVVGVVDNERTILRDIYRWIDEFYSQHECLPAFAALVRYADALRPSWSRLLASSRGGRAVRSYLRSAEYDMGLDGRGAGTLSLVAAMVEAEKLQVESSSAKEEAE